MSSASWSSSLCLIRGMLPANERVAEIHNRMPLILTPPDYTRWLSDEPDPGELMRPFPAEPMRMWPISHASTSRRMTIPLSNRSS